MVFKKSTKYLSSFRERGRGYLASPSRPSLEKFDGEFEPWRSSRRGRPLKPGKNTGFFF
jgi:hypothetical protein